MHGGVVGRIEARDQAGRAVGHRSMLVTNRARNPCGVIDAEPRQCLGERICAELCGAPAAGRQVGQADRRRNRGHLRHGTATVLSLLRLLDGHERHRALRGRWAAIAAIAAWGFGEAILLPVVPDVLLYVLAVAAPQRAAPLFGWAVLGALVGSLVLSAVALNQPASGREIVLGVPGITEKTLASAELVVGDGDPLAMVHLGPGIPLKVYSVAWWDGIGSPAGYVVGVLANRLIRIGPGVVVFWLIGTLAPMFVRRRERLLAVGYVLFWVVIAMLASRIEGISP